MIWYGLVALSLAGAPACFPSEGSCVASVGNGIFWREWSKTSPDLSVVCNPDHWQEKERCRAVCPLALQITHPKELASRFCLFQVEVFPYHTLSNLHPDHPLYRVEFPISFAGNNTADFNDISRYGCSEEDYSDRNGTIVLRRGGAPASPCLPGNVDPMTFNLGVPASIMIDSLAANQQMPESRVGIPYHDEIGLATQYMSRGGGGLIFDWVQQNEVRGYLDVSCEEEKGEEGEYGEYCPDLGLIGKCSNEVEESHRLCNRCPMKVYREGKEEEGGVCLWGNELLPRVQKNMLQAGVVFSGVQLEGACTEMDFAGVEGKVVFVSSTKVLCELYTSARLAEKHGAIGYVVIWSRSEDSKAEAIRGKSAFISIPVHSILASEDLIAHDMLQSGDSLETRSDAVADEREVLLSISSLPEGFGEFASDGFEFSLAMKVCVVLIAMLFGLVVFVLYHQNGSALKLPVQLARNGNGRRHLSLASATTLLAVSSLLAVGSVSFVLARDAGITATDTAMDSGKLALNQVRGSLGQSIEVQSHDARQALVRFIRSELLSIVEVGEEKVHAVSRIYKHSNSSSAAWWAQYNRLMGEAEPALAQGWSLATRSVKNLYADAIFVSSNAPKFQDNHTVYIPTHVADRYPDGTYGVGNAVWRSPDQFDIPTNRIGNVLINSLDLTKRLQEGDTTWVMGERHSFVCSYTPCRYGAAEAPTYSVASPLYGTAGEYLGAVTASISIAQLKDKMREAVLHSGMPEMKVVVFERISGLILADSDTAETEMIDQTFILGVYVPRVQVNTLIRSSVVINNALGHLLLEVEEQRGGRLTEYSSEFNQRDYFVSEGERIMDLRSHPTPSEYVRDYSASMYEVELRPQADASQQFQRDIIFNGGNAVHVYLNLTTTNPLVSSTLSNNPTIIWRSDDPFYNTTTGFGDGRRTCVFRESPDKCSLRGNFFLRSYTLFVRYRVDEDVTPNSRDARLFTESFEGETSVTLFASGRASFNIMAYGCETKPITTGIKKGTWVNLAVVYRVGEHCTSYVNGELHDQSYISYLYVPAATGNAYLVGSGFVGAMSSFQVFRIALSAQQVRDLAESEDVIMKADDKQYFVEMVQSEEDVTGKRKGFDVSVAAVIPRDAIMGHADRATVITQQQLDAESDSLQSDLRAKNGEAVVVVLVVILSSVLLFCVANLLLTRPFTNVSEVMCDAALMKVATAPPKASAILELDIMYRAMEVMTTNLKSYRPFLPDSLFEKLNCVPYEAERDNDLPPGSRSSTIALAFTDIVQSTVLWERTPRCMKECLRIHNKVMRRCLKRNHGYEVKTIGDAYMVAFDSAVDACTFGLEAQEELYHAEWPDELNLHPHCAHDPSTQSGGIAVRIGISFGNVELDYNPVTGRCDYFGHTVNKAARIEGLGIQGAVTVAQEVLSEVLEFEAASFDYNAQSRDYASLGKPYVHEMPSMQLRGVAKKCDLWVLLPRSLKGREARVRMKLEEVSGGNSTMGGGHFTMTGRMANPLQPGSFSSSSSETMVLPYTSPAKVYNTRNGCIASIFLAIDETKELNIAGLDEPLLKIISSAERTEGMVISIVGAASVVSWNGTKPCVMPTEAAFRFVRAMQTGERREGKGGQPLTVGLLTGPILSCSVGSVSQKFITSFSSGLELTWLLAKVAASRRTLSLHVNLLEDRASAVYTPLQRPIDSWSLTHKGVVTVYEVNKAIAQAGSPGGSEVEWGWSRAYWRSWREGDIASLLDNGGECAGVDTMIDMVASCLENRTHIVDEKVLSFLGCGEVVDVQNRPEPQAVTAWDPLESASAVSE